MFLDTSFLKNDEIQLVLEKTVDADPARNWLPAYHFAICDTSGVKMGVCDLRIGHNENTYYGGNIGYRVEEPFRGRHYAGKACKLLFELARRHGLEYVIITCNPDNWASRKTCEYAGGELVEIAELPEDNDMRLEKGETHECIYKFDLTGKTDMEDQFVKKLFDELSALPEVEAIALGGSRAGEVWDEKSDYDVYLYCTAPVSEDIRRELLGRYCSVMEIGNHFWEYEDNCTLNNGVDIDVLYRNLDDFTNDIASVVEQCQPRNGYTTCMWHNLRTCKILYDQDGRLAAAKARFDVPYPPLLRERIVERNRKLLRGSMPAYEVQIAKAVKRGDMVSVNHRTAAFLESYFDILFALNGQTHPGEKRLVQLCRKQCTILPERFEENLESLFTHLFAGDGRVNEDVKRIVDEMEKTLLIHKENANG